MGFIAIILCGMGFIAINPYFAINPYLAIIPCGIIFG